MKTLETERLLLRSYTMDDVEDLHRVIYSDPEVSRFFCGGPKTLEQVRENVRFRIAQLRGWWTGGQFGFLAVVRKEDGALIGLVALQDYLAWYIRFEDQDPRYNSLEVELTYAFGRDFQKQGYAAEACRALIEYAFQELKLRRLAYSVDQDNPNSWKLMERLGFRLSRSTHPDEANDVVGILDNTVL